MEPPIRYRIKWLIVLISGITMGLSVVLDAHTNLISQNTMKSDIKGFKLMVGPPGDFPLLLGNTIEIQPGHNNMISLSVAKISADTSIKESVDPVKRNCIFPEETRNTFYTTFFCRNFCFGLHCTIPTVNRMN